MQSTTSSHTSVTESYSLQWHALLAECKMPAPLENISSRSAIFHSFFTVSHCKKKKKKKKEMFEMFSMNHWDTWIAFSICLCCQYWKFVVSSINKTLFSHYKLKIITTFFPFPIKVKQKERTAEGEHDQIYVRK